MLDGGNESRLLTRKISEGLEVLNNAGEPVMKEEKFILKQQPINTLENYKFQLTAAYSYFADAALMNFCNSPKAVPVLQTKANLQAESAFLSAEKKVRKRTFYASHSPFKAKPSNGKFL